MTSAENITNAIADCEASTATSNPVTAAIVSPAKMVTTTLRFMLRSLADKEINSKDEARKHDAYSEAEESGVLDSGIAVGLEA